MSWSTSDIPDLSGKRAVVTGGTGGLGFHTALQLGLAGADVTITARNEGKADSTLAGLRRQAPDASFEVHALDLADLADVERSAHELAAKHDRIDIAVNNAGIMVPPKSQTADGFEMQMGTNHLGHFAWTAHLWPVLSSARIVSVSSVGHRLATGLDLDAFTPQGRSGRYVRWEYYGESKLANLLFARGLQRRIEAAGAEARSVTAHPGVAATELTRTGSQSKGFSVIGAIMHQGNKLIAQPASHGAWPLLMAATDPELPGDSYVGPGGFQQTRGRPRRVGRSDLAKNEQVVDALWEASERASGVTFNI